MSGKAETVTERMKSLFKIPPLQIICGLPSSVLAGRKIETGVEKSRKYDFQSFAKKNRTFFLLVSLCLAS